MIDLNDDILNKYIDGDLDNALHRQVELSLKQSEEWRRKFNTLMLVHSRLKQLPVQNVSPDFTEKVMKKIAHRMKPGKQQRYFITIMASIFVLFSLSLIGIAGYLIISSGSVQQFSGGYFDQLTEFISKLISPLGKLSASNYISIIGTVFSFAMIITGYLFFENIKKIGHHNGGLP